MAIPLRNRITAPGGEGVAAQTVTDDLLNRFQAASYRPPALPTIAQQVLKLSNDMNATYEQFCRVIESDPVFAARILRISRSALYTRRGEIRSVQQAVLRLGIEALRDIVIEDALNMHVFRCREYEGVMERLRRHSVVTAHLARRVADRCGVRGEYVFLCGLLHDIGIAVTLLAIADQVRPRPSFESLEDELHHAHPTLSSALVTMWELPSEVHTVVACHHEIAARGFPDPLAATVCLAEELANGAGVGIAKPGAIGTTFDRSSAFNIAQARAELGVDDEAWALLREQAAEVAEAVLAGGSGATPA